MTALGCAAARERAPELALGVLSGTERSEVLAHVTGCARCQAVVSELAEVADLLSNLAPEAEPPAGFERRVMSAMRGDRRRVWFRRGVAVSAVAAAAAILSVGVVRVIDASRADGHAQAAPTLRSVRMVGAGGDTVGRVATSGGRPASVAVGVDYHMPDGTYRLEVLVTGRAPDVIGTIAVVGGRGEWTGRATLPRGKDVSIAMTDSAGAVVCQASLAT